jgi:hypothetical protein
MEQTKLLISQWQHVQMPQNNVLQTWIYALRQCTMNSSCIMVIMKCNPHVKFWIPLLQQYVSTFGPLHSFFYLISEAQMVVIYSNWSIQHNPITIEVIWRHSRAREAKCYSDWWCYSDMSITVLTHDQRGQVEANSTNNGYGWHGTADYSLGSTK